MVEIAAAINRLADAVFSLGGTIGFFAALFFLFKKMSGHETITVKHDAPKPITTPTENKQ